ncbi:possible methyltransferase (chromatophore) [Paulinella micropora]|uniref:Possible methyltransferase n=1 Tax=Paulinella micropora TaxID=1928728 RepID=A0A1S6YHG8_9EUKA|nr:putative methyltransferase [Paulinella micropora]BBL85967.1 possible methyltransferase [Paulinella micropora]
MHSPYENPQKDAATSLVSAFYDRFPYPGDPLQDGPPPGYNWRWSYTNVVYACTGATPAINAGESIRILDAGCGTGVSTDYLCHLNPGSDILAIDISSHALEVARERLHRSNAQQQVTRLRQEQCSILDLNQENSFHYINCVGVLHHLRDPRMGLQSLGNSLVPGGLIHLFLYADGGRWEIHRTQRALKLMGIGSNDKGLTLGRKLFKELPPGNRLRKHHEQRWALDTAADANFADMYLHPQETSYNLSKLFNLIRSVDLEFIGFSNPSVWDLSRLLSGELLELGLSLPIEKQWLLMEALDPDISHFEIFISKGHISHYDWHSINSLKSATIMVNKCLWGFPCSSMLGPDFEPLTLDVEETKIIQLLEQNLNQIEINQIPNINHSSTQDLVQRLLKKRVLIVSPTNIENFSSSKKKLEKA